METIALHGLIRTERTPAVTKAAYRLLVRQINSMPPNRSRLALSMELKMLSGFGEEANHSHFHWPSAEPTAKSTPLRSAVAQTAIMALRVTWCQWKLGLPSKTASRTAISPRDAMLKVRQQISNIQVSASIWFQCRSNIVPPGYVILASKDCH